MQISVPTIIAVIYAAILVAGIVAGCTRKIVVFADLSDLLTTFSIIMGALGVGWVLSGPVNLTGGPLLAALAATLLAALAAIGWRSFRQNASIPATLLAVLTKIPFAAAVPLLVIRVAAPTGRTARERAASRASALLLLTIIAPLMLALVHDKDGIRRYLGAY